MTDVYAPMTGTVKAVHVRPGQEIEPGQELVTLESMKMEIPVEAEQTGRVRAVHVAPGTAIAEGSLLLSLEPA